MTKRAAVACLVLVLLLVGAYSSRRADAFVPAAAAVVPVLASTTGSTIASGAAAIGALLGSVAILNADTSQPILKLEMPAAVKDVPDGWSAGASPSDDPVPPASSPTIPLYYVSSGTPVSSPQLACQNYVDSLGAGYGGASGGTSTCNYTTPGGFPADQPMNTTTGCPAGYVSAGGGCSISNPAAVEKPADDRCGLKFSGGAMSFDSQDPDCSGAPPAGITKSSDGKTVTARGTNNTSQVKVEVKTDGSVVITTATPQANGTTKISQTSIASPSASVDPGKITQSGETVVSGTGPDAVDATPDPVGTPEQRVTFPDDYAREGTLQTAVTKLTAIETALTDPGTLPSDPVSRTQSEISSVFFPDTFTALSGWTLPARSVSCPTFAFSTTWPWAHSFVMDTHCSVIETYRTQIQALMVVVFVVAALFIVLGA